MSSQGPNPWAALEKFKPGGKGKLQMGAWSVPAGNDPPALPPGWFRGDVDDLACVICLEIPLQPASCPHCRQLSCMKCARQWFSSPTGQQCPMCRKDCNLAILTTQFSSEEREEIESRTAKCPLCVWEGSAFEVGDHLQQCPLRPTPCPNAGCKAVIRHKDLESHVQTSCAETRTTCPHCRKPFKGERGRVHIRSCPKEVIKCPREVNPTGPGRHPGPHRGGRTVGGQKGKGRTQPRARQPAAAPAPPVAAAAAAAPPPAAGPGQKGGAGKGGSQLALRPLLATPAAVVAWVRRVGLGAPLALACLLLVICAMAHFAWGAFGAPPSPAL